MYAGLNGLKGLKGVMGSERFKGLKTVLGSKRTRVLVVAAVGLVLVGVAAAVCLELPAGQALPARLRELARSWLRGLARDGPDGAVRAYKAGADAARWRLARPRAA